MKGLWINKNKKFVSLLLSLLLILGALPLHAIALGIGTSTSESSGVGTAVTPDGYVLNSQEYTTDELIGEVAEEISLREENVKHFRLSNGTYEAVIYGSPVHRKGEDGTWQDIDNSLSLFSDGKSKAYRTSDSRVSFADVFQTNEELFTLSEEGYTVSMTWMSTEASKATRASAPAVKNAPRRSEENVFSSLAEAVRINNTTSILYRNVTENTSLEYVLQGNDIKENIIVEAPGKSYVYQFRIRLEGLTAELDKQGNVNLYDLRTKEVRYVIPAPYMLDANGEYSDSVFYSLRSLEDGVYSLTVTADADWINAEGRAFPVTVDPSIVLNDWVEDAYVDSTHPDFNYNCLEQLWVSDWQTAYLYIPIRSLPSGASLTSAYLNVSYYYNITSGSLLAGAYQVTEGWLADEITYENAYENAPLIDTDLLGTAVLTASPSVTESTPALASIPITAAVSRWYEGTSSNYGIAIKREASTEHTNNSVILCAYEDYYNRAYITVNYAYHIPDGVYAIQNTGMAGHWMSVENDSIYAGSRLQHVSASTSPTSDFDRSSLFKISRVNGTERYIIRSMLNNNLTFGISEGEIVMKEIPSNDSNVLPEDTFVIEWNGSGYWIYPYGSTDVIEIESSSDPDLATVSYQYAPYSSTAEWSFVQYTGVHRYGAILQAPSTLHVGINATLSAIVWSTLINYNAPHLSVEQGYTDVALIAWDSSTRTGLTILHKAGELRIACRIYTYNSLQSYIDVSTYTLYPTLVIDEGQYFFKNRDTGKYMQIDDQQSPSYSQTNAHMELHTFDSGYYQRWELVHVTDGYYKILSVKSGLALCVKAGETNSDEVAIVQQPYAEEDRMLWKISESATGGYIVRPKSGEQYSTDWCLCAGDYIFGFTSGLNVEQQRYIDNDSYMDEWFIYPFDTSLLLAINDTDGYNRHEYFSDTKDILQTPVNGVVSAVDTVQYSSLSPAEMIVHLKSSDIFIIHTHGEQTGFKISVSDPECLSISDLEGQDLSNLSFALLLTCNTAKDYHLFHIFSQAPVNIVEQMVICGAETVIGFEDITYVDDCNEFAKELTALLIEEGLSVNDALSLLRESGQYVRLLDCIVVAGNGDNKLRE